MKHLKINLKKSIYYSFALIGVVSSIFSIVGYTIRDCFSQWPWWKCAGILIIVLIALIIIFFLILEYTKHKPYKTRINGKNVVIKVGDIFKEEGLKVIPFNDRYDTKVDDIIIAHNSLNGKMIDEHIDDLYELQATINDSINSSSKFNPTENNGKTIFPLGRLICYGDFLMLAFSHFDEYNQAYIDVGEYEQLLMRMWQEMRRVYAYHHIVIPLLGSGITTIRGVSEKDYTSLLKCILCTLLKSGFQPTEGITIVVTRDVMEELDMSIIKEEF